MEEEGCFAVVMEVSSHALALNKIDAIPFDYGVLTNLSSEHMDFHESLEDYYLTKKRLFELAKVSVFNVDDGYGRRAYKECLGKKISVGALFRGDVYASGITDRGFEGIGYLYHGRNFSFRMNLKTPGIYNVYNSLLAIAVATDLGEAPCRVKEALASFSGIDGRYEIIKDEITVIIDYAHTTAAFECILKSIRSAIGNKTLTVIFGAGGERDRTKRPKMASIAEKFADKIIVTEDNSRGEAPMEIITDIIKGFREKSYRIAIDRKKAIKEAILSASKDEVIAIIGKGCEKYNIDKSGYHRFDEKEIIELSLKERKKYANKA
jgi:UDP-N-acetylmuramoyl-L-alanyl-D-glutamate--2,6-diaminopimelate ligase